MKTKLSALLIWSIFAVSTGSAEIKSATFEGNSRSTRLYESSRIVPGYGTVTVYATTYDGSNSLFPLYQTLPGNIALFNSEVKPRGGAAGGALYDADFATWSSALADWIAYGSYTVEAPTDDGDGNGLADWGQFNKEANVTFSGTATRDYPGPPLIESLTGRFLRPANAFVGSWTLTNESDGSVSSGNWEVLHFVGSAVYERGESNALGISFKIDNPSFAPQEFFAGVTNYTILSEEEIEMPSFAVRSPSGLVQNILGPLTFKRTGNRYIANMELFDGVSETYWRDYIHHVIEITDDNDEDGDGVPDLSDLLNAPVNVLNVNRSGGSILISWPMAATEFFLQYSDSPMSDANWQDSPALPVSIGGNQVVTAELSDDSQFYRLKK